MAFDRKKYAKDYYLSHRESILTNTRAYRAKHPEVQERWTHNHRQEMAERAIDYYYKHRDELAEKKRKFLAEHPDKKADYQRRSAQNPNFRMRLLVRSRLRQLLLRKYGVRMSKTEVLIGCSLADLRKHLERQFQSGMNWGNRGRYGWHIDHIVPLSWFNLGDPNQLAVAAHYTNLQPMWAKDNCTKHAKFAG